MAGNQIVNTGTVTLTGFSGSPQVLEIQNWSLNIRDQLVELKSENDQFARGATVVGTDVSFTAEGQGGAIQDSFSDVQGTVVLNGQKDDGSPITLTCTNAVISGQRIGTSQSGAGRFEVEGRCYSSDGSSFPLSIVGL